MQTLTRIIGINGRRGSDGVTARLLSESMKMIPTLHQLKLQAVRRLIRYHLLKYHHMKDTCQPMLEHQVMETVICFLINQRHLPAMVLKEEDGMNGVAVKCCQLVSAEVLAQLTTTYNRT